jgi:hypothetical protein
MGFPWGTRLHRCQLQALYFNTNAEVILPSVDIDALLENQGPTGETRAALLDDSSESEEASDGANSLGQVDPSAE